MIPKTTMRKALSDPHLLGGALPGDSWLPWRTLLIATMGEPLVSPTERETFKTLTGLDESPTTRVHEADIIAGRRGGKTRALSILAAYLSCLCKYPNVVKGETAAALMIAMDRDQASLALGYAAAAIEDSPLLKQMIKSKSQDGLLLDNGIEILVRSPSFRRIRGRTAICVLCDEVCFWFGEGVSANPDVEILGAVRPMMATTSGLLMMASSPYAKRGVLYDAWSKHYGNNDNPKVLVARGTSQQLNPSLPDHVVAEALERDPDWARAEYLAEWRSDIETFTSRDTIEHCVEADVKERPFVFGNRYHAFVDAAGGSGGDSMTLAIAHRTGERVMIDATREVRPPFSPIDVTADFAQLMRSYRIVSVRGDRYAGEWVREQFRAHDISYMPSEQSKSQLYTNFLPLLNTQGVVLLDDARCVGQLAMLERRVRFGGTGSSIDHPPKCHDDIANAVAGVAVYTKQSARSDANRRRAAPTVHLGYPHVKAASKKQREPKVDYKLRHEIQLSPVFKPEEHLVGDKGHKMVLAEVTNDGRQKWRLHNETGDPVGSVFGRDVAQAALEQLIKTGVISR